MKVSLRLRPLEALHGLTARLASESGGGLLSDCLDVLLDAFSGVIQQQRFAHWRLVIAGDGPADYVAKLRQKINNGVIFTGWLDGEQKEAVLSNASLLVLPSHQENFGLCVMEAMSHGVPVLVRAAFAAHVTAGGHELLQADVSLALRKSRCLSSGCAGLFSA